MLFLQLTDRHRSMNYELIWEPKGVVKRFFGHLPSNELVDAGVEVETDARFGSLQYVINDFLACTGISVHPVVVDHIAVLDCAASHTNPNIRISIVATLPEIIAAANQYALSNLHPYPTRIFSTLEDARAWINE